MRPSGRLEVAFGALRGERVALPSGATVINDCYNASPLSVRAALDDLASAAAHAGAGSPCSATCSSSGAAEEQLHREIGAAAEAAGVDVLVTVGPRAAAMLDAFDGESYAVADAAEAAVADRRADRGRRRRARQGLARRRARGRGRGAGRAEVPHG